MLFIYSMDISSEEDERIFIMVDFFYVVEDDFSCVFIVVVVFCVVFEVF